MGSHAILSPSSASRWTRCPASAKLNAEIEYQIGLPGALGTAIHEMVEMELKGRLEGVKLEDYWLGKEMLVDNHQFKIEQDHIDCATVYVDYIKKRQKELGGKLLIEEKVNIEEISTEIWGTADALILPGETNRLVVADFKTGLYPVSPKFNYQMMIYGLGALARYGDENTVLELTIIQPRGWQKEGIIKTWDIQAPDLVDWGFNFLQDAAEAALVDEPEYNPGDWCKLCNAKENCETFKSVNMEDTK